MTTSISITNVGEIIDNDMIVVDKELHLKNGLKMVVIQLPYDMKVKSGAILKVVIDPSNWKDWNDHPATE